jgi:hypothetical protein
MLDQPDRVHFKRYSWVKEGCWNLEVRKQGMRITSGKLVLALLDLNGSKCK